MYTPTQNYGLAMPNYGDQADIEVINDMVTNKVDELLFQNRTISAPPFETTEAYTEDDLVVYENVLYRFTADKAAGAWDSSKVVQTSLAAEIESKGSGGASSLSDLTDTDIDTPNEGEVLTWDGEKWVNAEGTPAVTKTATGNPIEFSDGADAPLVKCVTQITGSQDLHGQDKPWVGGAGKNKLPLVLADIKSANTSGTWSGNAYTVNGVTFTVLTDIDGNVIGISISGTSSSDLVFYVFNGTPTENNSYIVTIGEITISQGYSGGIYASTVNNQGGTRLLSGMKRGSNSISNQVGCVWVYIQNGGTISGTLYPMIRLATETDPTFAPYSNICPITAYDEGEIVVRGKNLFDKRTVVQGSTLTPNSTTRCSNRGTKTILVKVGETFTISRPTSNVRYTIAIRNISDDIPYYDSGWKTATSFSFVSQYEGYMELIFSYTTGDITPSEVQSVDFQVERGATATAYEPYTSTTHTTTYPSAIYRGSEDVVNGSVSANVKKVVFDGSSDEEWSYELTGSGYINFYISVSDARTRQLSDTLKCNLFEVNQDGVYAQENKCFISNAGNFNATCGDLLGIDNVSDFKTWLASNNLEIAYELATPTTSSVTSTNMPIKSLAGYNHIESTTGDMEVEYITEGYQPLVDLIQESQHVYSTQEQIVGKWVDGSDLYERTFELSNPSQSGDISTGQTYDIVFVVSGYYMLNDGNSILSANQFLNVSNYTYVHVEKDGDIKYNITGYTATKLSVTIRYTKTPSNNRSLSKGSTEGLKADLSEVKGESDGILKEDKKALKIDESEDTETKEEADETEENADEMQDETIAK